MGLFEEADRIYIDWFRKLLIRWNLLVAEVTRDDFFSAYSEEYAQNEEYYCSSLLCKKELSLLRAEYTLCFERIS